MHKLLFLLLFSAFNSFAQTNIESDFCNCYTKIDTTQSSKKIQKTIRKCLKSVSHTFKSELEIMIDNSDNSIDFMQTINKECKAILFYVEFLKLGSSEMDDSDRILLIDNLAKQYGYPINKGKQPTIQRVEENEQAVLVNNYFNTIYTDSLFEKGSYLIEFQNTLIPFSLLPQEINLTFPVLFSQNIENSVSLNVIIQLKKDSIGELHKTFRENYIDNLIRPELRLIVRDTFQKIAFKEYKNMSESQISNLILENVEVSRYFNDYVKIIKVLNK